MNDLVSIFSNISLISSRVTPNLRIVSILVNMSNPQELDLMTELEVTMRSSVLCSSSLTS